MVLTLIASCNEEEEEDEERDQNRNNYWRAQIVISGAGVVRTSSEVFDCLGDASIQIGLCGPTLVVFDELHPPLLHAVAAPGWRFDHWETRIRSPFGFVHERRGPMPDGPFYIDGFGYTDTGELETVRAVFAATEMHRRGSR